MLGGRTVLPLYICQWSELMKAEFSSSLHFSSTLAGILFTEGHAHIPKNDHLEYHNTALLNLEYLMDKSSSSDGDPGAHGGDHVRHHVQEHAGLQHTQHMRLGPRLSSLYKTRRIGRWHIQSNGMLDSQNRWFLVTQSQETLSREAAYCWARGYPFESRNSILDTFSRSWICTLVRLSC